MVSLVLACAHCILEIRTVAKIPIITTTISSSISVKVFLFAYLVEIEYSISELLFSFPKNHLIDIETI